MKLISTDDTIIEIENNTPKAKNFSSFTEIANYEKSAYKKIINHANFKKLQLEKWMFVPCDDEGNVLEEPKYWNKKYNDDIPESELILCEEYRQAKERVIFEGCGIFDNWCLHLENGYLLCKTEDINKYTIEDIVCHNLTITPNAVKNYQL